MTAALFDLPLQTAHVNGITVAYRTAGSGPPLLLLHGFPQTHVLWHKAWPALTQRFTCVAMDLRGYGDSAKPDSAPPHAAYSKRTMAQDAADLMALLNHRAFAVLAHDRGARVAHRLALDHPQAVMRMVLLDIAPTLDMYRGTNEAFARLYAHWFFLIRPAPFPERLIDTGPTWFVQNTMASRFGATGDATASAFTPQAMREYERCAELPGWAHAVCEDYRAAAGIDLEHDAADRAAGRKVRCPVLVLAGTDGVVARLFDAQSLWAAQCDDARYATVPGGHYIPEEAADDMLAQVLPFFT
jgi:haloacetate dehalogenase